ncbi:hypothetical protein Sjap_012352 [Stephania japonica]|uniref:Cytochrome P450 n=1 Tax=Stephania japonica TaxID=461633 RepID=A0AAP0IWL3_9MAGN
MDSLMIQSLFWLCFFFVILSFTLVLRLIGSNVCYCSCEVCHTYLTSKWALQFNNLSDWYTHLLKNSPTGTIQVHVLGNTITANPSNVEYILKTNFDNYPKGKPFSTILKDFLGRGIFNVDGELWKYQRKMACLELGNISIRSYAFEIVSKEIKLELIPVLSSSSKEGTIVDLQKVFRSFTFNTICQFTFGLDPAENPNNNLSEFAAAFDLASRLSAERALSPLPLIWKIKRLLNIGSEKQLKQAIKTINGLANEIICQRRLKMMQNCISRNVHLDLLSRFMTSNNESTFLRDIIISFALAGRDSVASALTTFFWLVARNPGVDSAILAEWDRVMGASEKTVSELTLLTYEQTLEMPYLTASLYESMRLYPPVQFDSKHSLTDDVLPDGTVVRRGSRVTYHPYAMGRMGHVWGQDCLEFRPERWLVNGRFVNPVCAFKYPVFQAGVRVCLGKEMALMEMKCVAMAIIRGFEIRLVDDHSLSMMSMSVPKFDPGLTATLRGGLSVILKRRER